MPTQLPTKLGNSPLVDVIFEVRIAGKMPLASIITGMLFSKLGCSDLQRLPHADIPDLVRQADPNLRFVVLSRLSWGSYFIGVGDNVVTLSPSYPYPGWTDFRDKIIHLVKALSEVSVVSTVDRYSLKYIDVLDYSIHNDIEDALTFKLNFNDRDINRKTLQVRAEIPFDNGVHILQIVGQVKGGILNGPSFEGVMLDVDSIRLTQGGPAGEVFAALSDQINDLHYLNKELFFEMLTDKCLERMEPEYA